MSSIRRRTRSNTSLEERQALVDEWERKEPTPNPPVGMPSAIPNFLLHSSSSSTPSTDKSTTNTIVKMENKGATTSNRRKRTRVISDDDDDDDSSVILVEDESKELQSRANPAPAEIKVKLERNLSTVREEKKETTAASTSQETDQSTDRNNGAGDEDDDACAICFEEPPIDPATLDSCKHSFCFECIFRWSTEVASTCPLCKHDIHEITHYGAKEPEEDKQPEPQEQMMDDDEDVVILSKLPPRNVASAATSKPVEARKPIVVPIATKLQRVTWENNDENLPPEVRNARCQHCGNDNNEDQLLLCDGCDQAWHTYCVGLDKVPEGDFFCPQCEGEDDGEDDTDKSADEEEPRRKRLKRARDTGSRGGGRRGRGRPRRDGGGASSAAAPSATLPVEHPTRHQPSRVRQTSSLSTLSSPNEDFASQMAARLAGLAPPKPAVSAGMSARARLSVPSAATSSPFTAPLPPAAAAAASSSSAAPPSSSSHFSSYFSGSAPVIPTAASPHARTKKTTVTTLEAAWNARNELMMLRERERFMAARREAREILKRQEEATRAKAFGAVPRPRPLHSLAINAHAAAAAANATSTSSPAAAAAASAATSDWGSRLTPPPSTYHPVFRTSLAPSKFKSNVATKSRFTAPTTSSSSPNNSNSNAPLRRRIPKKFEPVQMKFNSNNSNPSSPSLGPNASPTGSFPSTSPFFQRHVSPSWGAAAAATASSSSSSTTYPSRNIPTSASKPPHMSSLTNSSSQNNSSSRTNVAPASSLARIPSPVTTPTAAARATSPFSATNGNWSNFGPAALKPRSVSPPIPKPQISRQISAATASGTTAPPTGSPIAVAATDAARFFPSAGPARPASPPLPPMLSFADFEMLYSGSDGDSTAPVTVGTHSSKSHRPHAHAHSGSHRNGVDSHSSHDKHREERRREKEERRAKEREREKQKAKERAQQGISSSSRPFTAAGQPVGLYQHPNHRQRLAAVVQQPNAAQPTTAASQMSS